MSKLNISPEIMKLLDSSSVKKESKEEIKKDSGAASDKYSAIIGVYKEQLEKRSKQNLALKVAFFVISFSCLVASIVLCFIIVISVLQSPTFNAEVLVAILGSLATFITSMLLLPKIIGKYLYPNNEDEKMLEFIKAMRGYENDLAHDEQMKAIHELKTDVSTKENKE